MLSTRLSCRCWAVMIPGWVTACCKISGLGLVAEALPPGLGWASLSSPQNSAGVSLGFLVVHLRSKQWRCSHFLLNSLIKTTQHSLHFITTLAIPRPGRKRDECQVSTPHAHVVRLSLACAGPPSEMYILFVSGHPRAKNTGRVLFSAVKTCLVDLGDAQKAIKASNEVIVHMQTYSWC